MKWSSSIRKQLRGDSDVPSGPQPTLQDLLRVQTIAEQEGGVETLLEMLEQVETAAARAGGIDRLKQCLRALKRIKA